MGQTPWCKPTTPSRHRVLIVQGKGGGLERDNNQGETGAGDSKEILTQLIVPQARGPHVAILCHKYYTKCHLNVPVLCWGHSASAQPSLRIWRLWWRPPYVSNIGLNSNPVVAFC